MKHRYSAKYDFDGKKAMELDERGGNRAKKKNGRSCFIMT
jgi:hypothetical protein